MNEEVSEQIKVLEGQIADRMHEHQRFMERFINDGDHNAKERADQVMHIVDRHRKEIAELQKQLDDKSD